MRSFVHWFLVGVIIIKNVASQTDGTMSDCHPINCNCTNTADGKLYANCFKKGYKSIPTGLGNVQILNISANPLLELTSIVTMRYPEIIELNMHSIQTLRDPKKFQWDFLLPLTKLEVLNISNTKLLLPPIVFPPTIRKLYANAVSRNVSFVDFSVLKNVNHLEMNDCSLHGLPTYLPKEAPLKQLHLENNYLENLNYVDLANYCLLEQLRVAETDLHDDLYQQCCDISLWLEDHNVTNDVRCVKDALAETCDRSTYLPDSRALYAYEECTRRNEPKETPFWVYFIVFSCLVLVLSTAYVGFKYYQRYRAKKAAEGAAGNRKIKNKKLRRANIN